MAVKVEKLPKVIERTGLKKSSIYSKIKEGLFPAPILLGKRSVGWIEEEVSNWIENRIQQSREQNTVAFNKKSGA
jgi:prophage regulatory protein